ncbi:MAG TPA: phosphatase [Firmicutes bacterium]|nr:phosphatase [Bacillota bacterium]
MKYVLDAHTHTIASGHAYSTIMENAAYAAEAGLELLGITDHAPAMAGGTQPSYFLNFSTIPREISGVEIYMGAELNIMDYDGNIDLDEFYLQRMDYAIASLHPPCIPFGTMEENTNAVLKAMENPYVKILGHPGDPRYPIDCKAIVDKAVETETLIEINDASLIPNGFRKGSEVYIGEILKLCQKKNFPVILASDAHFATHIGKFDNALRLINEAGFPEELIINRSKELFKNFLKLS